VHERSLIDGLVKRIAAVVRQAGALRAAVVRVRIGALASISAEHFREHFESETAGTPAAGARLDVSVSEDAADPRAQEVLLESVDVEVEDES
jgi:hydrogenase nickel incorporation protein HypA/HybF